MNEGPLRSLALYVAVVGSSLLGVFAVLRVGEGLTAPPAVAGVWNLDFRRGDATACEAALPVDARRMTIAQSGQFLVLHFDDRRALQMAARLRDGKILGQSKEDRAAAPLPDCPGAPRAEVELDVAGSGSGARLDGVLRLAACARCPALNLRATRAAVGEK